MDDQPTCTYCGDPADTEDHLDPVSRQTTRRRRGKMASCGKRVPCCALCNSLLGACDLFSIRERAAFLMLAYARRDRIHPLAVADKIRHLVNVAAGFPLPEAIEELEAERRRRLAEDFSARRAAEDADLARRTEIEEAIKAEAEAAAAARTARMEMKEALKVRRAKALNDEWIMSLGKLGYMKRL